MSGVGLQTGASYESKSHSEASGSVSRVSDDRKDGVQCCGLSRREVVLFIGGGFVKVAAFGLSVAAPFAYDAGRYALVKRCRGDWQPDDMSAQPSEPPPELPNCKISQEDYGLARGLLGASISFIFVAFLWKVLERRLDNRQVYKPIMREAKQIVSGHGLDPTPLSGRKIERKTLLASIAAGIGVIGAIVVHEYFRLQRASDIISQCKKSRLQCGGGDTFEFFGFTVDFISVLFALFAGARICANKASNVQMPITQHRMRNLEEMIEHILTDIYDVKSFENTKRTFFEKMKMNLKDRGLFVVSLIASKLLILGVNALYDAVEAATLSNCLEKYRNEKIGSEDLPLQECTIDAQSSVIARGMLFVMFLSIILAAVLKYRLPSTLERKKDKQYQEALDQEGKSVSVEQLPLHRKRIPGAVLLGAGALLFGALHEFLRYNNVRSMVQACKSSEGVNCNASDDPFSSVVYYVFIFFCLQAVNHVANIFPSPDEKRIAWLSGVLAALKATEESDDDSASSSSSSSFGSGFGLSSISSDDDS